MPQLIINPRFMPSFIIMFNIFYIPWKRMDSSVERIRSLCDFRTTTISAGATCTTIASNFQKLGSMEMTIIAVLVTTTMKTIYVFIWMQRRHAIYSEREDDGYAWRILPTTTTKITMTVMRLLGGISNYGTTGIANVNEGGARNYVSWW